MAVLVLGGHEAPASTRRLRGRNVRGKIFGHEATHPLASGNTNHRDPSTQHHEHGEEPRGSEGRCIWFVKAVRVIGVVPQDHGLLSHCINEHRGIAFLVDIPIRCNFSIGKNSTEVVAFALLEVGVGAV